METFLKKNFCCALAFFSVAISFGQDDDSIFLKWKIAPGETLKYFMVESQTVDSYNEDNNDSLKDYFLNALKAHNKPYRATDTLLLSLTPQQNLISINEITVGQSTQPLGVDTLDAFAWTQTTAGDTIFRGSIYDNGSIASFYNADKKLLASCFQLPNKKIKVGDSWSVDLEHVSFSGQFVCDSCFKKNIVSLVQIKKNGSETIAVINYDIIEYASGGFRNSLKNLFTADEKFSVGFKYNATGEFSVDAGRWIAYKGTESSFSTMFIGGTTQKSFFLRPQ